jgi:hypothetical protein
MGGLCLPSEYWRIYPIRSGTQKSVSIPVAVHQEVQRIVDDGPALYSTPTDFVVTAIREEIRETRQTHRTQRLSIRHKLRLELGPLG